MTSHDRIDALGSDAPHLGALQPVHLDRSLDPELQRIAREAAEALDAPIALVSLVLDRVQFFKAHHGLEGDLAATRATDRDVSFCQFVVRDEAVFEVADASTDTRVPQHLVRERGLAAYLGAPVRANGTVVGSLCVLDTRTRAFTEAQRARLTDLAERASARLDEMDSVRARGRLALLERSVEPVFPELRNLLTPLTANLHSARLAVSDLAPVMAVLDRIAEDAPDALSDLAQARGSFQDLDDIVTDLETATSRLRHALVALESVMVPTTDRADLARAVEVGRRLAEHRLKLVPEVDFTPVAEGPALAIDLGAAVGVIAAALAGLAQIAVDAEPARLVAEPLDAGRDDEVGYGIEVPGASVEQVEPAVRALQGLAASEPFLGVDAVERGIVLRFILAPTD